MDPKQTAQLDPKLQEAYNRVMGTVVAPSSEQQPSSPAAPQTPATPAAQTTVALPQTPAPQAATSNVQPLPVAPIVMPHTTETVRIGGAQQQPAPQIQSNTQTAPVTKKKGLSPIIYVLGAILFLIAYTIVWVKVLHVPFPFSIPFLTQ